MQRSELLQETELAAVLDLKWWVIEPGPWLRSQLTEKYKVPPIGSREAHLGYRRLGGPYQSARTA